MVCSIGTVFKDTSAKFGEGHTQDLVILLGKSQVIVEIVDGNGQVGHKSLVGQGLISVGVKTTHGDHVYFRSQVPFDESGQEGQLPGKTIVLVFYLVLSAFVGLVDQSGVLVSCIGHTTEEPELVPVHTIVKEEGVQAVLHTCFRDLLQLVDV